MSCLPLPALSGQKVLTHNQPTFRKLFVMAEDLGGVESADLQRDALADKLLDKDL